MEKAAPHIEPVAIQREEKQNCKNGVILKCRLSNYRSLSPAQIANTTWFYFLSQELSHHFGKLVTIRALFWYWLSSSSRFCEDHQEVLSDVGKSWLNKKSQHDLYRLWYLLAFFGFFKVVWLFLFSLRLTHLNAGFPSFISFHCYVPTGYIFYKTFTLLYKILVVFYKDRSQYPL